MARASNPISKEAILDAAESVALELGVAHMTLDSVAARANVSKGGLLYSFPNKDALLKGLLDRMLAQMAALRNTIRAELPENVDNELLVEIKTIQSMASVHNAKFSVALLAAVANQQKLISVFRADLSERFFGHVTKTNFLRSAILFYSALGMHFHTLLGVSMLDEELKNKIFGELCRLVETGDHI